VFGQARRGARSDLVLRGSGNGIVKPGRDRAPQGGREKVCGIENQKGKAAEMVKTNYGWGGEVKEASSGAVKTVIKREKKGDQARKDMSAHRNSDCGEGGREGDYVEGGI